MRYLDEQATEDANIQACLKAATVSAHSKEDAEMCDEGNVSCPLCPFKSVIERRNTELHKILDEDWKASLAEARIVRESVDTIDSYSDETIKGWLEDLHELDVDTMPSCPFSFNEIRKEVLHREFLRDLTEEM